MAQILVLGAPPEGCAGKHGRSIPLGDVVRGTSQHRFEAPPVESETSRFRQGNVDILDNGQVC